MSGYEYGVEHHGRVIVGPGWACVADVMAATHGRGEIRVAGTLVRRALPDGPWEPVDVDGTIAARLERLERQHHDLRAFVKQLYADVDAVLTPVLGPERSDRNLAADVQLAIDRARGDTGD